MIYTRFGSPLKIVGVVSETRVIVEFEDKARENREVDIWDLKADGGMEEIQRSMADLEPDPNDDYSQHEDELYQPSFFEPID